eukprot:CAMPEP_0194394360 /NCGR_PEP_ID=MMETSP0174-20130528/123813_1 /TAXON_ID=216777 /ORGANISM="Proboscia alata, Strain PI-D3" /LENGTH=1030 /DNA_ID=CAMNT_0039190153 /DNA_START=75 /DNA_END=3167 /DNA_ORIENTATION=-
MGHERSVFRAVPLLLFMIGNVLSQTARPSTNVPTNKPTHIPTHKPTFIPTNIPTVGGAFDERVKNLQYYLSGDFEFAFDDSSSSVNTPNKLKPIDTNTTDLTVWESSMSTFFTQYYLQYAASIPCISNLQITTKFQYQEFVPFGYDTGSTNTQTQNGDIVIRYRHRVRWNENYDPSVLTCDSSPEALALELVTLPFLDLTNRQSFSTILTTSINSTTSILSKVSGCSRITRNSDAFPTHSPTVTPTTSPSSLPSRTPSSSPSLLPSLAPSSIPTLRPTAPLSIETYRNMGIFLYGLNELTEEMIDALFDVMKLQIETFWMGDDDDGNDVQVVEITTTNLIRQAKIERGEVLILYEQALVYRATSTFVNQNSRSNSNSTRTGFEIITNPFDSKASFLNKASRISGFRSLTDFEKPRAIYPTDEPSTNPSDFPSPSPSDVPSDPPSPYPSISPSVSPTVTPTLFSSDLPSSTPSVSPSNGFQTASVEKACMVLGGLGVMDAAARIAWEQQTSVYLRNSYDVTLDSDTENNGGVFNVNVVTKYITSTSLVGRRELTRELTLDPDCRLQFNQDSSGTHRKIVYQQEVSYRTLTPPVNTTSISVEEIVTRPFQHAAQKNRYVQTLQDQTTTNAFDTISSVDVVIGSPPGLFHADSLYAKMTLSPVPSQQLMDANAEFLWKELLQGYMNGYYTYLFTEGSVEEVVSDLVLLPVIDSQTLISEPIPNSNETLSILTVWFEETILYRTSTDTPNIQRIALEPFATQVLQEIVAQSMRETGLPVFQNVTSLTLTSLERPTALPTALPTNTPSLSPLKSPQPTEPLLGGLSSKKSLTKNQKVSLWTILAGTLCVLLFFAIAVFLLTEQGVKERFRRRLGQDTSPLDPDDGEEGRELQPADSERYANNTQIWSPNSRLAARRLSGEEEPLATIEEPHQDHEPVPVHTRRISVLAGMVGVDSSDDDDNETDTTTEEVAAFGSAGMGPPQAAAPGTGVDVRKMRAMFEKAQQAPRVANNYDDESVDSEFDMKELKKTAASFGD